MVQQRVLEMKRLKCATEGMGASRRYQEFRTCVCKGRKVRRVKKGRSALENVSACFLIVRVNIERR